MKPKNKNYKKISIISLTAITVVVLGFWFWQVKGKDKASVTGAQDTPATINYSPPTEEEEQKGDQKKQEIEAEEQNSNTTNTSDGSKKSATVLITDAAQYGDTIEVRAFIPNHFQDGTCIIQFTKDSQTFKRETPAYADSTTTICTNPVIKTSEFPTKGVWQVKVSYSSADAAGASASQPMEVK